MTGPEHYREAEYLLEVEKEHDGEAASLTTAVAQVHATLALAASNVCDLGDRVLQKDWIEALT